MRPITIMESCIATKIQWKGFLVGNSTLVVHFGSEKAEEDKQKSSTHRVRSVVSQKWKVSFRLERGAYAPVDGLRIAGAGRFNDWTVMGGSSIAQ